MPGADTAADWLQMRGNDLDGMKMPCPGCSAVGSWVCDVGEYALQAFDEISSGRDIAEGGRLAPTPRAETCELGTANA